MGPGRVAARPVDGDEETVGWAGDRPRLEADLTGWEGGIYMECDDRLDPPDGSLAQQLVGTTREQFLGGLEDESHAAGEGGQFMEGQGDSDGNGGRGGGG